ncbi:TraX family protein [Leptotrichia wadei]|nr:TraX family protein [Leptotrichia wadei]
MTLIYNEDRGKWDKILNYLFYPVHLLILGLLRLCFKIGI